MSHRCANWPCPLPADHLYRTIAGLERWLCAGCRDSLNAHGFGWERLPTWLERGREGIDHGKVLVA